MGEQFDWMVDPKYSLFDDLAQIANTDGEITNAKQIHELIGDPIIIDRYKGNFDFLFNRLVGISELCWGLIDPDTNDKLQRTPIKIKHSVEDNDTTDVHVIPMNRLLFSLSFLRPLMPYIEEINLDDFLLRRFLSQKDRQVYQDMVVRILQQHGVVITDIQAKMARMSLDWKMLLKDFAQADISIFTAENLFLDHYREDETIREINNTEYPSDMQTADIVEENAKRYQVLEGIMTLRGNPFFVANKYVKLLKPKQMEELYINFSQIPDGRNIIPVIMNGNGFRAGYNKLPVFYTGAIASRVPDIMNKDYMGIAGYFNRNLMILSYGTISPTVWDCGSQNPIPIEIDECMLEMMDGRYYYNQKGDGILRVLRKTDKDKLGKKLWFRSPCTCNLNEDCCHICYGQRALKVGDLKGGFVYTTEQMTNPVQQNILSAKHLLKSNAEKIVFSTNFDKYFVMDMSTIIPRDDKKFDIYIREDYTDNIAEQFTCYIGKDLEPVTISNYASINIPEAILDKCKEVTIDDVSYYKISSYKILEADGQFCMIIPINIMMTQRYMDIMHLFELDITKFEKVEDIVTRLAHMTHNLIPILSTHGEILIGHHLRSIDNKLLRPNWLVPDQKYQIMRLKTVLQNTESFTTALAFEQTKHHLLHTIFDERNAIKRVGVRSFHDYMFGEEYAI
ncbi:MAG: hypothetical protein J5614_08265 [Paludibacteraceae bacterium]|nr:hypothetical protein [Paludibacteraceae bacterium]